MKTLTSTEQRCPNSVGLLAYAVGFGTSTTSTVMAEDLDQKTVLGYFNGLVQTSSKKDKSLCSVQRNKQTGEEALVIETPTAGLVRIPYENAANFIKFQEFVNNCQKVERDVSADMAIYQKSLEADFAFVQELAKTPSLKRLGSTLAAKISSVFDAESGISVEDGKIFFRSRENNAATSLPGALQLLECIYDQPEDVLAPIMASQNSALARVLPCVSQVNQTVFKFGVRDVSQRDSVYEAQQLLGMLPERKGIENLTKNANNFLSSNKFNKPFETLNMFFDAFINKANILTQLGKPIVYLPTNPTKPFVSQGSNLVFTPYKQGNKLSVDEQSRAAAIRLFALLNPSEFRTRVKQAKNAFVLVAESLSCVKIFNAIFDAELSQSPADLGGKDEEKLTYKNEDYTESQNNNEGILNRLRNVATWKQDDIVKRVVACVEE